MTPLTLELGADLSALAAPGTDLAKDCLEPLCDRLFAELGVRVPGFCVRRNSGHLPPNGYALLLDDVPCGSGLIDPSYVYVLAPPASLAAFQLNPIPVTHPATGKEISAILPPGVGGAEAAGLRCLSAAALLGEGLLALLKRRAPELLGVQEVQTLLDEVETRAPSLVKEALNKVPLPLLTEALRQLVSEGLSVRHLKGVLEALVAPQAQGDVAALTEWCRRSMARQLSHKYAPTGPLFAYLLDPAVEDVLRRSEDGLDPEQVSILLDRLARAAAASTSAVVLTSPDVRRKLRRLAEGVLPELPVLTYSELEPSVQIRPVGKVTL